MAVSEKIKDSWEKVSSDKPKLTRYIIIIVAILLIALFSFLIGVKVNRFVQAYRLGHTGVPISYGQGFRGRQFGGGQRARIRPLVGSITQVGTNQFTLQANNGTTYQTVTNPNTRFTSGGNLASFSDIKVGEKVAIIGQTVGNQITAARITINPVTKSATGST